jgi:branched-chain amino acid transport system permease protein
MVSAAGPRRGGALTWILSGDPPRNPALTVILLAILIGLAAAPFLFPGTRALAVAARICVFIVMASSYDILLGYTGIVSFAHTLFFGIGAYGVAAMLAKGWVGWDALILGALAGIAVAAIVAAAIALLSLRVRAIFFAMITLAVASFARILATEWRSLTGGEDGLTFSLPEALRPSFHVFDAPVLGIRVDGRVLTYYLVFAIALVAFLVMLRVVNSPFGRVLQAIRENEFRTEALGLRPVVYRTVASAFAAAMAALAGAMLALLLRYNGPDTTLSLSIMVDVLLMVVIGGMGTLYGAAIGAVVIVMAQYYLQNLLGGVEDAVAGWPVLPALFHPDRWLLWLGLMFVLIVYFFPSGIVGRLRKAVGAGH